MHCSNCGRNIPNDAVFCPYCAAKVTDEKTTTEKDGANKKHNALLAIAVIMLTVALCTVSYAVYDTFFAGKISPDGKAAVQTTAAPEKEEKTTFGSTPVGQKLMKENYYDAEIYNESNLIKFSFNSDGSGTVDVNGVTGELSASEISDNYAVFGMDNLTVNDAKQVKIELINSDEAALKIYYYKEDNTSNLNILLPDSVKPEIDENTTSSFNEDVFEKRWVNKNNETLGFYKTSVNEYGFNYRSANYYNFFNEKVYFQTFISGEKICVFSLQDEITLKMYVHDSVSEKVEAETFSVAGSQTKSY